MRTPFNPQGDANTLIDKMIGNAYDIVKYVACYLREIRYVAENMEQVFIAANGNRRVLTGNPGGTSSLALALPSGVTVADIDSITAQAVMGGNVFLPGSSTFAVGASSTHVNITGIDASLRAADFKVIITTSTFTG